jgi:hypothetical protein
MVNLKTFSQFNEETTKTLVFTFGRFNPPTIGHQKLLDKVSAIAGRDTYRIYVSQSVDSKKNPLSYDDKIKFLRKMFTKYARSIILDKSIHNALEAAVSAYDEGFTRLVMVVGSDRIPEFQKILKKYEGVKGTHGYYRFDDGISVVSAGERDPDADGVEGMSASKMRSAASSGDLKTFSKGLPSGFGDSIELFNAVRVGMGLEELREFRQHTQLPSLSENRDRFARGEILKIGEPVKLTKTGEKGIIEAHGPNHLVVRISEEVTRKVWITDVISLREGWATDLFKKIAVERFNGKKVKGIRYIDDRDVGGEDMEILSSAKVKMALDSLDGIGEKYAKSFEVFKNPNDQIVFKQISWTPNFSLS